MIDARTPERTAELTFRPDPRARVLLALVGLIAGAAVAALPAALLAAAHLGRVALAVLAAGFVFGPLRANRVSVTADRAGLTIRHVWSTEVIRWKRVERLVADRRMWLPGLIVPTLKLRGDRELVALLGACSTSPLGAIAALRNLHRGSGGGDWRTETITVRVTEPRPAGRVEGDRQAPGAPAIG